MDNENESAELKLLGSVSRRWTGEEWAQLDRWDEEARKRNSCLQLWFRSDRVDVYEKPGVYDGPRTKRPHVTITTGKAVA